LQMLPFLHVSLQASCMPFLVDLGERANCEVL
jgi:hypothetical protein